MPRLRRILLLAAGALAFSAGSAYAARPSSATYDKTVSTTHFVVHYTSDSSKAEHASQNLAGDIGAYAERAYSLYVSSWGYPAPADDGALGGDGKTDIYIVDLSASTSGNRSLTVADNPTSLQSSAYIEVDYKQGTNLHQIGHALFDAIALGIWNPTNASLTESAAEWAASALDQYALGTDRVGGLDLSLDCYDPTGAQCGAIDSTNYDDRAIGTSHWLLSQYLADKYGTAAFKDVLTRGAATASRSTSPVQMLSDSLAAKGTSLSAFYDDWAQASITGGFTPAALQTFKPVAWGDPILTGTLASLNPGRTSSQPLIRSGAIPTATVPVDHLATRYVELSKGDGVDSGPCYAATLTVNVTIPSGSSSQPYFQWQERNSLGQFVQAGVALSINGSTASTTVPWDTCKWNSTYAYLALPNASMTADSLDFAVSGTITIDTSTVGASGAPSLPFDIPGTVVAAPTSDGPPQLDLLGPATIHVYPDQSELRVIVISNGPGSVQLTLNGILLGTFGVRAGTNDVRAGLPLPALLSAPRTAKTLLLTPFSPGGQAGTPLSRTLVVDPSPATATAKKAKAKKKRALRRKATRRRL